MNNTETPFQFLCNGAPLLGIVHSGVEQAPQGVIIVVGGPQYRVGSHRQFVLLARALAGAGIPSMRFDYRGMGDSDGEFRGFEHIGEDIRAAVDAFQARSPGLKEVVLWGLCDAASAVLFYAAKDSRVHGIVLLNPWVRTPKGEATTYLKHYYTARLIDRAFWRKVVSLRFDLASSIKSLMANIVMALPSRLPLPQSSSSRHSRNAPPLSLPERMALGLRQFRGRVLLIISGNDYTAREFEDVVAASPLWRELLAVPRVTRLILLEADHTFSRQEWQDWVAHSTIDWITSDRSSDHTLAKTSNCSK